MDQEFSVEKQDFTLVKEKIIKTNELLLLYKEKTEKLTRATQAFKHLKLNYETAQLELNKFKVDNERLNDTLERLKPKQEQTETQLKELKLDCAKIEEKYQQHIIECQLITAEMESKIKQCNCEKNLLTSSPSRRKTADEKVRELKQKYSDLKHENNNLTKKYKYHQEKHVDNEVLQKELAAVKDRLQKAESSLQHQSNTQATIESLKQQHKMQVAELKENIAILSLDTEKLKHLEMECRALKEQVERTKSKKIQKKDFSTQTDQILDREKLKLLEMECAALKEQVERMKSKNIQRNDFSTQTDQILDEVCMKLHDTAIIDKQETQMSIFDEPAALAPFDDSQKYVGTKKDVKDINEDSSDLDCSLSDIFREMIMPSKMLSPIKMSSVLLGSSSQTFLDTNVVDDTRSPEKIVPHIIVTPPTPKVVELNSGISGLFPILTDNPVDPLSEHSQCPINIENAVPEIEDISQENEDNSDITRTSGKIINNSISLEASKNINSTTGIIPKKNSSINDFLLEDAKKKTSSSIDDLITLRTVATHDNLEAFRNETTALYKQENLEKHLASPEENINQLPQSSPEALEKSKRRRKFWIPYSMNFVKSRRRLVRPSKAIKKLEESSAISSSDSDTILNALKTLQQHNINFTISNESIPLVQPYNWNAMLSATKSELNLPSRTLKSTFSCKMDCWNDKCTKTNSLMMLRKGIHQDEPELLGFFNVKDEVITPSVSRMALSEKPNNVGIQEFVDKLLNGLKEFANHKYKKTLGSKQKKKFIKSKNRSSEFNSETESELERLFMGSANVLRKNRKLLAAAKEQSFESNGESVGEESESDVMGDSGLVTATPNTVIDEGMITPIPKDFKNCISGHLPTSSEESILDSSEKKKLSEFSLCPVLISPITNSTPVSKLGNSNFKVPKSVISIGQAVQAINENSMDSYKTPFCPALISPMASSTKSSPEASINKDSATSGEKQSPTLVGLKKNQVCSYMNQISSSLCQKITFDSLEHQETFKFVDSNIGSILAADKMNIPNKSHENTIGNIDISIKTSDLNCTLNDINLSQLECSLATPNDHEMSAGENKNGTDDLKEETRVTTNVVEYKTRDSKRKFKEQDTKTTSDVSNEPPKSKRSCLAKSKGVLEECSVRRSGRFKKCDESPEKLVQQEQSDPPARNLRSRRCSGGITCKESSYTEQGNDSKKPSSTKGPISKRITRRSNCEEKTAVAEKNIAEAQLVGSGSEATTSQSDTKKSQRKINTKPGRIVSKEYISEPDSDSSVCPEKVSSANKRLSESSKLNASDAHFEKESKTSSPVKNQTSLDNIKTVTSEIQSMLRECSEETTNQNATPVSQALSKSAVAEKNIEEAQLVGSGSEATTSQSDIKKSHRKINTKPGKIVSKEYISEPGSDSSVCSKKVSSANKRLSGSSKLNASDDHFEKESKTISPVENQTSLDNIKTITSEIQNMLRECSEATTNQNATRVSQADIFGELSSSDDGEPVKLPDKKSNPKKSQNLRSKMLKQFKGTIYAANKICDNSSCVVKKTVDNSVKSEKFDKKINIVQNIVICKGEALNLLPKSDQNKTCFRKRFKRNDTSSSTTTSADILSQVMQDMTRTRPVTQTKKIAAAQTSYNNYHSSLNIKEQFSGKLSADVNQRNAANKVEEDFDPYEDCPKSPDVHEVPDRLPRLIPTEKPNQLSPSKVVMLIDKLIIFGTEEKVLDEVIWEFAFQTIDYVVEIIIQKLRLDIHDKAEKAFPLSPPMTITQRILLGFLCKLDKSTHPGILDKFLDVAELEVYNKLKCELTIVQPITRLYTAICRMRMDVNRIRKFICDSFYFCGDFAVPTLFVVLTMWPDVWPLQSELSKYPLAKMIVHLCFQKSCAQPGYNLVPLWDMFRKYYGYRIDDWSCEDMFQEILVDYIRNPSIKLSEFAILVFLKNKPVKWVCQKMKDKIMPLYDLVPESNPNLKVTLLILLGNIGRAFNKFDEFEWSVIQEMNKWFQGLEEGETNLVVRKGLQIARSRLPKKIVRKRPPKKDTNETQQSTNNSVTKSARLIEDSSVNSDVSSVSVNNVSIKSTKCLPCLPNDEDSEKDGMEIDSNVNIDTNSFSLQTNNSVNNVQISMDSNSSASDIEF